MARALISFLTGMLLARWVGPEVYGKMAFLLGTFVAIRQLLDMGVSSAFFTFMSQRSRDRQFVWAFFAWLSLQFFIPLCVIGLIFPVKWIDSIWQGEGRVVVLLAFSAVFMQHSVWPAVQQAGESQRRTILVQTVGVLVMAGHFLAMLILWIWSFLGLYSIFIAITLEYLLAAIVVLRNFPYAPKNKGNTIKKLLRKYFRYCAPLIPFAWVSFVYQFVDRWMLQKYGGSFEQAYYAVAAQVAGVALIATSSILRIFWKEVAEAHYAGDNEKTGRLYQRVSRLLFFVGSLTAGFLIPWANELIRTILGEAYISGSLTLTIMFLYPVHQSMGQIGLTMLIATERVTLRVVSGIIFMLLGMIATYFILASAEIPGLGLASEGLAIKMVVMQIIEVNIIAFLIARIWKWRFDWLFQPINLLGCLGAGWVARKSLLYFVPPDLTWISQITIAGVFYCGMIAAYLYLMPWVAGFSRNELYHYVRTSMKILMNFTTNRAITK